MITMIRMGTVFIRIRLNMFSLLFTFFPLLSFVSPILAADPPKASSKNRAKAPPTQVFRLKSRQPDFQDMNQFTGLLSREIYRQAILIAARDELGLATRDQALRESMKSGDSRHPVLDADIRVERPGNVKLSLFNSDKDGTVLFEESTKFGGEEIAVYYQEMIAHADSLSRGAFVNILKEAGYSGAASKPMGSTTVPKFSREALCSLDYVLQFGAVRQLHSLIRKKGPSPELLDALVRAYANLGILVEFHWTGSNKVFKARALLYAERAVAQSPRAPWAYWSRAYARALGGLHAGALDDLKSAGDLSTRSEKVTIPDWVPLIEAYCRFDSKGIRPHCKKKGPLQEFALLLDFLTVRNSRCERLVLKGADAMLDKSPFCYRAHDEKCEVGGVNNLHSATMDGPMTLSILMPIQLLQLPCLPRTLKKSLESYIDSMDAEEEVDFDVFMSRAVPESVYGISAMTKPAAGIGGGDGSEGLANDAFQERLCAGFGRS